MNIHENNYINLVFITENPHLIVGFEIIYKKLQKLKGLSSDKLEAVKCKQKIKKDVERKCEHYKYLPA